MDFFVSLYKDPLFSIIIIMAIIVLIAIADYTKNKFKNKAKKISLKAMADNFKHYEIDYNASKLIDIAKYPIQTLTFIANIYVTSGNFDEAIKIYLTILEKIKDTKQKLEILELLGTTYYKAGFIQRAKNIFIEILKHNHRHINVLLMLMQSYELLGDYKNAIEVASCLEELDTDVVSTKQYINILMLINDSTMPLSEREEAILKINTKITNKITLNYFKTYDINQFWNLITKIEDIRNYIDILWNLPPYNIEKIKSYKGLADVYRAKGIINDDISCDIFELEALRVINKYSSKKGDLEFKYRCTTCQGIYPFDVNRCPNCGDIGNINLIFKIMENTL